MINKINEYFILCTIFTIFLIYLRDLEEPQHHPEDSAIWTLRIGWGLAELDWGEGVELVEVTGDWGVDDVGLETELFALLFLTLFSILAGVLDSDSGEILDGDGLDAVETEVETGAETGVETGAETGTALVSLVGDCTWDWAELALSEITEGFTIGGIKGVFWCSLWLVFIGGGTGRCWCCCCCWGAVWFDCEVLGTDGWFWVWGTPKRIE